MNINAKRLGQIICLIAGIIIYGNSAITVAPQQASSPRTSILNFLKLE